MIKFYFCVVAIDVLPVAPSPSLLPPIAIVIVVAIIAIIVNFVAHHAVAIVVVAHRAVAIVVVVDMSSDGDQLHVEQVVIK
jgi:hypothetical protein